MNVFFILAIVALLATVATMVLGIRSMTHGGEEDQQASSRLMFRRVEFQAAAIALILAAVFLAGGWMDTPDRTSDRLAVDMGVMPAEAIRSQYGADSAEANAFGGVPGADDSYLVTFAVRERESDRRVEDASVTATVGQLGLSGTSKELRPATFGGIRTFGNYFHMPRAGLYEIELRIERPGVAGTDLVRLQYHRS